PIANPRLGLTFRDFATASTTALIRLQSPRKTPTMRQTSILRAGVVQACGKQPITFSLSRLSNCELIGQREIVVPIVTVNQLVQSGQKRSSPAGVKVHSDGRGEPLQSGPFILQPFGQ